MGSDIAGRSPRSNKALLVLSLIHQKLHGRTRVNVEDTSQRRLKSSNKSGSASRLIRD
jgi:hypothetical protein